MNRFLYLPHYSEIPKLSCISLYCNFGLGYSRVRWSFFAERNQIFNTFHFPFKNRFYASIREVSNPPCHIVSVCFAPCFRPKKYSLNSSPNKHVSSDFHLKYLIFERLGIVEFFLDFFFSESYHQEILQITFPSNSIIRLTSAGVSALNAVIPVVIRFFCLVVSLVSLYFAW